MVFEYAIELFEIDGEKVRQSWMSHTGEPGWRVVDYGYATEDGAVAAAREFLADEAGYEARVYAYDADKPEDGLLGPEPVWGVQATIIDEEGGLSWRPMERAPPPKPEWVDPYADKPNGRFGEHILMELTEKNRRPRGVEWNAYGGKVIPTYHPLEKVLVCLKGDDFCAPAMDYSSSQLVIRRDFHEGECKAGRGHTKDDWFFGTREECEALLASRVVKAKSE